jgi:hypothetical protein
VSTKPDPRLYVLMRPETDRAVVLRQGPSKVFCTLGWDLKTDKVVVGQWCKHKIYVERCDISSSGKYFVYFALDGKWSSEAAGAWTALSYAPYLKALKLWPQGNTWGGGGVLYRDRAQAPPSVAAMWDDLDDVDGDRLASGVQTDRMKRDGWIRLAKGGFQKPLAKAMALRTKVVSTRSRYGLVSGDAFEARPAWTWADIDATRKRLLWAEDGVLHGAPIKATGLGKSYEIFDARDMTFEAIAAPYKNKTVIVTR